MGILKIHIYNVGLTLVFIALGKHNLTLMFNSIETKERLEEDAVEHGNQIPVNEEYKSHDKVSYM